MSSPFVKSILRAFGHDPAKRQARRDAIPEATQEDNAVLDIAGRYSDTGRLRMWSLLQAVQHIARANIAGDIVECGVWKGGNLILSGLMLKRLGVARRIWGFDTFAGMSEPTDADTQVGGIATVHRKWKERQRGDFTDWAYAPIDEVQRAFRDLVGTTNLNLIKGKVEDTLDRPENLPGKIAILRLDTDWYESTKKELEVLYPRLEKGGVLIVDDYGHWAGAKKAVDEYFADSPVWLHRIDYTGRLHIKN